MKLKSESLVFFFFFNKKVRENVNIIFLKKNYKKKNFF